MTALLPSLWSLVYILVEVVHDGDNEADRRGESSGKLWHIASLVLVLLAVLVWLAPAYGYTITGAQFLALLYLHAALRASLFAALLNLYRGREWSYFGKSDFWDVRMRRLGPFAWPFLIGWALLAITVYLRAFGLNA